MSRYVLVSGLLFGLVFAAHVARLFAEGIATLANPMFAVTSLVAVAMCGWAARLLRATSGNSGAASGA